MRKTYRSWRLRGFRLTPVDKCYPRGSTSFAHFSFLLNDLGSFFSQKIIRIEGHFLLRTTICFNAQAVGLIIGLGHPSHASYVGVQQILRIS